MAHTHMLIFLTLAAQALPTLSQVVSLPTVAAVSSVGGVLDVVLTFEAATHTTSAGTTFTTRALNGTVPGPTLRLKQGDTLKLDFQNKLEDQGLAYVHNRVSAPDAANVHFHGLHVSGELPSDDATVVVAPGENRQYETTIPADHMPGTHWLHPHRHGSTALQVGGGAALAIIVEDPPGTLPAQVEDAPELLLLMQQVDHEEIAEVAAESGDSLFSSQGTENSFLMINGEEQPTIDLAAGEWTRVRLVYAAWLVGDLNFGVAGCDMVLLAKDGVYIRDFPRDIAIAPVPPGGRADVMLRCPDPSTQYTVTGWVGNGGGGGGMRRRLMQNGGGSGSDSDDDEGEVGTIAIIQTRPAAAVASSDLEAWTPTYPAYLTDLRATPADSGCSCETEFEGGDGDGGAGSEAVNGRAFEYGWFMHQTYLGAVVEREIDANEHPYHQHVNPYQLISGFTETEYYKFGDWHDTAGGSAVVRYTAADFVGKVMVHCHRLMHEDGGMMAVEIIREAGECSCGFFEDDAAPAGEGEEGDADEEDGDESGEESGEESGDDSHVTDEDEEEGGVPSTTPTPTAEAFSIRVSTTLTGVTAEVLRANLDGFRASVASLHDGISAENVKVDEDSIQDVEERRRLLAAGVSVDYEVTGFAGEEEAAAAKTNHEAQAAALETSLKANGFETLEAVTSTASVLDSGGTAVPESAAGRPAEWGVWSVVAATVVLLCTAPTSTLRAF